MCDIALQFTQPEGQYFDRKSLWHGPADKRVPRDRKAVRDQIAEYVAAFANADDRYRATVLLAAWARQHAVVPEGRTGGSRYLPGPRWELLEIAAQKPRQAAANPGKSSLET